MKKLFRLVLVLALLVSLSACSMFQGFSNETPTYEPAINVPSDEPTENVETHESTSLPSVAESAADDWDVDYNLIGGETAASEAESDAGLGMARKSEVLPFAAAPGSVYYDYDMDAYMPFPSSSESYLAIEENQEKQVSSDPVMTFSLKVDTAAYTNVARYIESGNLPPEDAVRIEEMINYFPCDARLEAADGPFAIYTEIGPSPFSAGKYLAYTRVKARDIEKEKLPRSNLTFLIDTSGSMDSYDKLPLLKEAFSLLVETLSENDKVSIVTYAGSSEVLLDSVSGADKETILDAMDRLDAYGSTAGADGILTAYALAEKNYIDGGNNRVILATDGDFNVGLSDTDDLATLVGKKRGNGLYLSILGFGTGNIRDDIMETLSKEGNGNYAYIRSVADARKVLVEELAANLFTIADDVKAQIEFNPAHVRSYRLIGYDNRMLANEDFEDDTKDAGEIGIGTDVVILYEIELTSSPSSIDLKYQAATPAPVLEDDAPFANELFEVRIRYKDPGESESKLLLAPATTETIRSENSSDFRFAGSVAAFGHLLRGTNAKALSIDDILTAAQGSLGKDEQGYRQGFVDLLRQYRSLGKRGLERGDW